MDSSGQFSFFPLAGASITVTDRLPASTVVRVRGALDMDNAAEARSALSALLPASGELIVDLAGVTFLGSAGIRTLVQIYHECETAGVRFRVHDPEPASRHVLEICGLSEVFGIPAPAPAARPRLVDVLFERD